MTSVVVCVASVVDGTAVASTGAAVASVDVVTVVSVTVSVVSGAAVTAVSVVTSVDFFSVQATVPATSRAMRAMFESFFIVCKMPDPRSGVLIGFWESSGKVMDREVCASNWSGYL